MNGRTEHTHLAHLQAGGEALQIGGHSLAALAAICGGTPFYAYSREFAASIAPDPGPDQGAEA